MTVLEKHFVSLQRQLEHLNTEVAALIALTSASQDKSIEPVVSTTVGSSIKRPAQTQKTQIGINRYRQLANE